MLDNPICFTKVSLKMPTFRAVVQPHQQRKDGTYPVSIRITHNRKSKYMQTGIYITKSQITRKGFEIKDSFVLERMNKTITSLREKLLQIGTEDLMNMSCDDVYNIISIRKKKIDFLAFCRDKIEVDKFKTRCLAMVVNIFVELGWEGISPMEITSKKINQFKEYLDNKTVTRNGVEKPVYTNRTKIVYLGALHKAFVDICKEYNTEYDTVIKHDPFIGVERYKREQTRKRSIDIDTLRSFFNHEPKIKSAVELQDIMRISFCLCGMNVIDILSLKKENYDPKTNRINYERRKTRDKRADNARSSIRIEPEIQEIAKKHMAHAKHGYLFDFMNNVTCDIRNHVKTLTKRFPYYRKYEEFKDITPYWFRHTWATIARNDCNVSKDDIDLCLNHVGNNPMADVYIKEDWSRIDVANRKVLDYVFHNKKCKG